ncbi:hypothetical protein [Paenibacillus polymyxa]|uniref:Uncharacterized protein n=1 Tax=Paenibacillus polymyxa (strain SC2) TaxID=886882 RepID=E3EL47_PAEPS|nr:hypothetical protein [Paenibacillus polymyxa]ADO59609.1 hypothetical protein PPSC2_27095 [Paenibacillus polymyxa SC2]WPQ59568.1 hypothetical protein SKN87_28300 [Paenibacillus polymyxa]
MDLKTLNVLRRLNRYASPIKEKRIQEEVLRDCREKRVGLTRDEIIGQGLNIYEKRGEKISTIIDEAIHEDLVRVYSFRENSREIMITPKGIESMMKIYTSDFSSDFVSFENELRNKTEELGELPLKRMLVASLYWRGKTVEEICQKFFKMSHYHKSILGYHEYLLQRYGHMSLEDKQIFHFQPMLFLPKKWMNEVVTLEIEGIDAPDQMILMKPYPNKRYVVAGCRFGKEKTSAGFYPIITDPNSFPEKLDVTLRWKVGEKLTVVHHLLIEFKTLAHDGNLFSSEQRISRSCNMDSFSLTTFMEQDEHLGRGRHQRYFTLFTLGNKHREYIIQEKVTLTNFPMHLHATFHADRHFQQWLEKKEIV